jgi:hypothetical protein
MLSIIISEHALCRYVMDSQNTFDSADNPQVTPTLRAGVPRCTDESREPDAAEAVFEPMARVHSPPAAWEVASAHPLTERRTRYRRWLE